MPTTKARDYTEYMTRTAAPKRPSSSARMATQRDTCVDAFWRYLFCSTVSLWQRPQCARTARLSLERRNTSQRMVVTVTANPQQRRSSQSECGASPHRRRQLFQTLRPSQRLTA